MYIKCIKYILGFCVRHIYTSRLAMFELFMTKDQDLSHVASPQTMLMYTTSLHTTYHCLDLFSVNVAITYWSAFLGPAQESHDTNVEVAVWGTE